MKNIDPRDFSSMMEGLDIGTQPAANEGAPFTGDNQTSTIQNDGVYNEILNAPTGSYIEEMPFETTEELLKLSKFQK